MGAMLDMMGQMMGKKKAENADKESKQGGEGSTGDTDQANSKIEGKAEGSAGAERRVPRAAGESGPVLPEEFLKALQGYNKKKTTTK